MPPYDAVLETRPGGRCRPRWPAWVYAALAAVYLLPFWAVPGYLPSAVGLWWRHRDRPNLGFAAALTGLLLACYFAHILAAVVALAGIGVLWLASWRRERWRSHLSHLAILAPAAVLPAWFILVRPSAPGYPSDASWQTLWSDLAH